MRINMIASSKNGRILIFLILGLSNVVYGIHLSVGDQFYLIDQEPILINILEKYIDTEDTRLDGLQKFKDKLTECVKLYSNDDGDQGDGAVDLAWNPLAIFKTMKYLTIDFDTIKKNNMIENSYADILPKMVEEKTIIFPDENHIYGAIHGVVGLQKAQNLTVRDMIEGNATHLMDNVTLTSEDCFHIGVTCAKKHHHQTAVEWLQECGENFDKASRDQARSTLISSTLFTGDKMMCRQTLNKCLREESTNRVSSDLNMKLSLQLGNWNHAAEEDQWMSFKTCAGDFDDEYRANQRLKCRYNHHNSPFLTIAPLKEEMVSLEPKISIFREAVYDSEIERLYSDSISLFRTSMVVKSGVGDRPDLQYRPSQTTFLNNKQPKYASIWNRLEDMSSLSLRKSESFQMLHYAPGGFYRVHPDYLPQSLPEIARLGNRVATALMYLNSVPLGGNTVFPRLKLSVEPVKGSVLLWINMKVDGSEETNVKHAACPVIFGEKLACTQWFRMLGQDHWIAEPEDDTEVRYFVNPNIRCPKRYPSGVTNATNTL